MPMLRCCMFAIPLLVASAPAQTTAAPPAPHVLIDTVGPDGWRLRLGPTNLGGLLASEQGRALWEPHTLPVFGFWKNLLADEDAFRAAKSCVLGYGGRIRVAVWLQPRRFGDHEIGKVAMVLEGDGRTDLGVLAAEVRRMQERLEGAWSEVEIAGTKLTLRTNGDDAMTAPIAADHCLLLAMATKDDVGAALAAARSLAGDTTGKPPLPNTPALLLRVDTAALVAGNPDLNAADADGSLLAALGLGSLGASTLSIGTAGPHVQLELTQSFTTDERGLFAALFPATQGVPTLHRLRPANGSWKVGRFDAMALWKAIERALAAREEDVRAEAREELGIDIVDDLLAHLTDETLLSVVAPGDPEDLRRTPWSFVMRLRDEAAFAKGLDTALAKGKPVLQQEAILDVPGGRLRRYGNMLGYDLWFATGQGLFVIAGGGDCEGRLTALFDAEKTAAGATSTKSVPQPAEFDDLLRALPNGLNGLGRGDLGSVVGLPLGWWLLGSNEMFGVAGSEVLDDEQRERLFALAKEHHLDTLRSGSGYADRRWSWRLYW